METTNRNILVVDDMSNWRTTVETLLKSYGFTVTVASNAVEAFRALKKESYSAAILDARLDDMDDSNHEGISTVLAGIHRECPKMGFIVISSYYSEAEVRDLVPEGVSITYFDKSNFRINDLIAALEHLSGSKNA
jgi:DNA-binding NtrC family response regulator